MQAERRDKMTATTPSALWGTVRNSSANFRLSDDFREVDPSIKY